MLNLAVEFLKLDFVISSMFYNSSIQNTGPTYCFVKSTHIFLIIIIIIIITIIGGETKWRGG